ncbi:acetylxylan esterase [Mucilaginibacter sp.]|jgi:cephalosporin-C deacetylase-like acetyl esterase|uniref:acetylxylan esterase n=1 Tax=Mucilaginibacter sp. TaxID=1882438 RepID=UPI002BFEE51A|nr:acetylxylan esterase [Mucilaginibacter sp.]HTI59253.1 acetylxylan esterase [Mucilaginibacter sp.]
MFDKLNYSIVKNSFRALSLVIGLFFLCLEHAAAQREKEDGEVVTEVVAHDANAIFSGSADFTFSVKNSLNTDQEGTVGYLVTTEKGDKVLDKTIKVKIDRNSNESYDFHLPELRSGFYKINFMINTSDYDDTTRKAFGIKPQEIRSQYTRPADFNQFWDNAKAELAKVKPDFKVTALPKQNTDNREVFLIEMKSLDNYTIRGYLTVPKTRNKSRKFAVLLGLPGYQVSLDPMLGLDNDLAIITLNVRGQGNSRDEIDTRRDEYITYRIEDKNKYVMRGVIMDCVRCIDFIYSQKNLEHDNILVSGGSMGGYLALAVAGVDKRVNLCSAQNPILCDIRRLVGEVDWPVSSFRKYVATQPGLSLDKVLGNMDYYDAKNFAQNITCPTLMGIGLLDPFAPPNNEYSAFNVLQGKRRIMVFKNLAHEINEKYKELEGRWMRDTFALF